MEGMERLKKEADHSRLVAGKFNKPGNLLTRLALGNLKMSTSLPPPARILKAYTETLMGFSHVYCLDGLNTLLSQCHVLENTSHCGTGGQNVCSKDKGRG